MKVRFNLMRLLYTFNENILKFTIRYSNKNSAYISKLHASFITIANLLIFSKYIKRSLFNLSYMIALKAS